jgi:hypothetical protein
MKIFCKGMELIDVLEESHALLDSKIIGVNLFEVTEGERKYEVVFQIDLEPVTGSFKNRFRIEFRGVSKFDFYFGKAGLCYVERFKFFQLPNGEFYLSIDPYDEGDSASEDDCGVVCGKEIAGILLEERYET